MVSVGIINVGGNINNFINILSELNFVKTELINDKFSLQKKI